MLLPTYIEFVTPVHRKTKILTFRYTRITFVSQLKVQVSKKMTRMQVLGKHYEFSKTEIKSY